MKEEQSTCAHCGKPVTIIDDKLYVHHDQTSGIGVQAARAAHVLTQEESGNRFNWCARIVQEQLDCIGTEVAKLNKEPTHEFYITTGQLLERKNTRILELETENERLKHDYKNLAETCRYRDQQIAVMQSELDKATETGMRRAAAIARELNDGHDWPVTRAIEAEADKLSRT